MKITDDSGFLAIVNSDTYHSFVDENWEVSQLMHHFVHEMKNNTIVVWATGSEGEWSVSFLDKPTTKKSFREFTKTIEVTKQRLYLTNYEDLAMAAQYKDMTIPAEHNAGLVINLDKGLYAFTVRQMLNPEDSNNYTEGINHFEVIIEKVARQTPNIEGVYWWVEEDSR